MFIKILILFLSLRLSCPDQDEYCAKCINSVCEVCYYSYVHRGICTQIEVRIENCLIYDENIECILCEEGYYLYHNTCMTISNPDCHTSLNQNTCQTCKNSTIPTNGLCDSGIKCSVIGCLYCDDKDICHECEEGKYLDQANNFCFEITNSIKNCKEHTEFGCSICTEGYYWSNGECLFSGIQAKAYFRKIWTLIIFFIVVLYQFN